MKSNLSIFFFMGHAFGVKFKNQCWVLKFLVLSKNFIVVHFTFKSVIHFELVFLMHDVLIRFLF